MAKKKTWQQQAAGLFSMGGRAAPNRDMAMNAAPLPYQQQLMQIGVPRDRLAEAANSGRARGIMQPAGSVASPFQRQLTTIETADSPQSLLDAMRKKQGMPRETLGTPALDDRRLMTSAFRSGDFSGTDAGQFARPSELDAQSRLIQSTRGHNPTRRSVIIDGEEFGVNGDRAPGTYGGRLPETRVGVGRQSNGMVTGGAFGSSLMMSGAAVPGMAMGAAPQQPRPELPSRPMQYGAEATPSQFAEAWKGRKMTTSDPEKQAAATEARQAAMAERQGAVKERGMARGQAREERMQFARDREQFGDRGALVRAFQRQGVEPERAFAMMQGNMQWLSEDNRQRRAADEFAGRTAIEQERNAIERDRLDAEIAQSEGQQSLATGQTQMAGQQAYEQAEGGELDKIRAGQMASGDPNWKPMRRPRQTSSPQSSGVPQAQIDALRASGNTAHADALEEQNRRLEEARRRTGMGGLRGLWDDWWNVK